MNKVILTLAVALLVSITSFAQNIAGGTTGNLTWSLDTVGNDITLTISGNDTMPDYRFSYNVPWASYRNSIASVVIDNGVTTIGNRAFEGCESLTSVIIPNSVTTIGYSAFGGCWRFTSITIPSSVTSIGDWAFDYCIGLTSIIVHAINPPTLGANVFGGVPLNIPVYVPCGSLHAYQTTSDWRSFINFVCLSDSSITYYFASICSEGSYNDNHFTDLTQAGLYYDTLQNVSGGDSIVCLFLSIEPHGTTGSLTWSICNGALTISGNDTMPDYQRYWTISTPWYNYRNAITTVVIGDSVKSIGSYAFFDCPKIVNVPIPNSVTNIKKRAFMGCERLTAVIIPNSVTSIGEEAFDGCSNLTSITLPNSITRIEYSTFSGCTALTSITIPNSVTYIGNSAFLACFSLTSVVIGNGVISIGFGTFYDCISLMSITIYATSPPIVESPTTTFHDVPAHCSVYIPCGTYDDYRNAPSWAYFSNFMTIDADTNFYQAVKCYNKPYTDNYFTIPISDTGTYYTRFANSTDCDSVICLTLYEYAAVPITYDSAVIRQGETYTDDNFTNLDSAGIYYDTLQNINGCDSIICLNLIVINNITEAKSSNFIVYPNPTNNTLHVTSYTLPIETIEIYDIYGKLLLSLPSLSSPKTIIDISHLANGIYFLKINNNIIYKLIKK